ncbi:MAG: response regulator transcription factor [Chitinophagaceae bacterium]
MQNILLAEDDPEIAKLINLHLSTARFHLTYCASGEEALRHIASNNYHLVILDISLPDIGGMEICKYIRSSDANTPIMILTCHAEESDKVLALESGADDYVTKPFGVLELMVRVKALLRRSNALVPESKQQDIVANELHISSGKRMASLRGVRLELTVKEFDLLCLLAGNPGKNFTRKDLLQKVWGFAFAGYEHTVTSHINRLRLKLETDLNHPKYILTAWGYGYHFAE